MKKITLIALAALLTLTGCRSSRKAEKTANSNLVDVVVGGNDRVGEQNVQEPGKGLKISSTGVESLSSKMDLTLGMGKKSVKVGGTYRLKRNDVIQINLTYTLLITINVGTLELTRDSVLVLDRLHNQYCRAAYSDIPMLQQAGIDFDLMQRVFWGEAGDVKSKYFQCSYGDWTNLGKGKFPRKVDLKLTNGSRSYFANFTLNNPKESKDWDARTRVSGKYTAVPLETVMKMIMAVAQ